MKKFILILPLILSTLFANACFITSFQANISPCDANDTFIITGTIGFVTPPTTGTLTITDMCTGRDTVINAPFTSPTVWSISNIPTSFSGGCSIVAVFSADTACNISLSFTAPQPCNCVAQIGTFTTTTTNGINPYELCIGDQFTITASGGFVAPGIANNPLGPGYNPSIGYLVYSCPPTIAVFPSNTAPNNLIPNDPCFIGLLGYGNSFTDVNLLGAPSWAGSWVNSTVYIVPITWYDTISGTYSYVNTTIPCYEMGAPIAIQYLPGVTIAPFGADTICSNSGPVTLPVGSPAGGAYSGIGVVGSTFDPAIAGVGSHYVVYTNTTNPSCTISDSTMITVDICTGIASKTTLEAIVIYPNPAQNVFYISSTTELEKIIIIDVTGKLVLQQQTNLSTINVATFPKGIYFIQLQTSDDVVIKKFVKN